MIDRAALEGLYNEAEAASAGNDAGPVETGLVPGGELDGQSTDAAAPAGDSVADNDAPPKPDRARDSSGKFAKDKATRNVPDKVVQAKSQTKQGGKEVAAPAVTADSPPDTVGAASLEQPAPVVAETVRAPQSLTPAEREVFAKAPPEIQQALTRLDNAARVTARDFEPAKRFHAEMSQALAPIRGLMQMRNVSEAQAVSSYANFDRMLSDPATSAQAAAQLLRSYNVNIEHLAAHLDRTPAPTQGAQSQSLTDPRAIIEQAKRELKQEFQETRQQSIKEKLVQDVQAFAADPKNEFFEDVHPEMTALLNANPKLSLADAYKKATRMNDDVSAILDKRAAAKAGKASTASTQQARVAASSVKSTPSTGASTGTAAPKNHRDMVAAIYEAAE